MSVSPRTDSLPERIAVERYKTVQDQTLPTSDSGFLMKFVGKLKPLMHYTTFHKEKTAKLSPQEQR
jgi:hypothetical protein